MFTDLSYGCTYYGFYNKDLTDVSLTNVTQNAFVYNWTIEQSHIVFHIKFLNNANPFVIYDYVSSNCYVQNKLVQDSQVTYTNNTTSTTISSLYNR